MAEGTFKQLLPGLIGALVGSVSPSVGQAGARTLGAMDSIKQRNLNNEYRDERMELSREAADRSARSLDNADRNFMAQQREREANRVLKQATNTPQDPELVKAHLKPGMSARILVRDKENGGTYWMTVSKPNPRATPHRFTQGAVTQRSLEHAGDIDAQVQEFLMSKSIASEQRAEKGEDAQKEFEKTHDMSPEMARTWDVEGSTRRPNEPRSLEAGDQVPEDWGRPAVVPQYRNTPSEKKALAMSEIELQQTINEAEAWVAGLPPEIQEYAMQKVLESLGQGMTGGTPVASGTVNPQTGEGELTPGVALAAKYK